MAGQKKATNGPWTFLSTFCVMVALAYLTLNHSSPSLLISSQWKRVGIDSTVLSNTTNRFELAPDLHVSRKPTLQRLNWKLSKLDARPDGVRRSVYSINSQFPGPTIETRTGDHLIITVENHLSEENVTIHWHGLNVPNFMDGMPSVTQLEIQPGDSFVYDFVVPLNQAGTFWYHAHTDLKHAEGLYGAIVVHKPASGSELVEKELFGYDRELLLQIGDWYHQPAAKLMSHYMSAASFGNEPVPDSLLINGVGRFECEMAVPARPVDCISQCPDFSFLALERDSTYRIRVINTGSMAGFTLQFADWFLEVIALDGVEVQKQSSEAQSAGILFPGQRMDLILRPSQKPLHRDKSNMMVALHTNMMPYFDFENCSVESIDLLNPTHVDVNKIPSASSVLALLPLVAHETHVVYTKIQKMAINENEPWGYFNSTSWRPQQQPRVPLIDLPRAQWDKNQFSISTGPEPIWVDIVLNNLDDGGHPFHLHGHNFYVLHVYQAAIGWGSYNPFKDSFPPGLDPEFPNYDLSKAVLRDTVYIPRRAYAVLRFQANNPGLWFLHCHIVWHLAGGMAMIVDVMGG
ncbi:hypothetical protein N7462_004325 [Penicillium macrosclerotiorum]|uniref:uncharacterized protein n=1 Tax=Penicillium macrosclerotiorum TaxID=303699 RepID=UPI002548C02C|nr:uncharacterized protein N7462_004325 [Penicillium macrosclerotiorum]KAJ5689933.1 hypothetical protein N7462_004325 [Penicillium macrosclerotiorum]